MVRSKEEILSALNNVIGESLTDEAIALVEDVTDTLDELEGTSSEDWKKKYEENDLAWRKRYKERFLSGEEVKEEQGEDVKEDSEEKTFDDLFEEKED